jgi:NADH dehydrogenase
LPWGVARAQAAALEVLNLITLGLLPDELTLTRDQVALLMRDNVVSEEAEAEGRTFQGLGIAPTAFEAIAPAYLVRFRKTGQFEIRPGEAALKTRHDAAVEASARADAGFEPRRAGGVAVGQKASR